MVALAAFLLLLGASFVPSAATAANLPRPGAPYADHPGGDFTLDGGWFLRKDPTNIGLRKHFQNAKNLTPAAGWTAVTVPNAFNAGDFSEASYTGSTAWYANAFTRPSSPKGSKWILHFDSVNYQAHVWLNGHDLGKHDGGYVPFEIDASSMKPGVNHLVVRVDSHLSASTIPSQEVRNDVLTGGWWNYGGIVRDVTMRRVRNIDISDVATRSAFKSTRGPAKITVVVRVRNTGRKKARLKLTGRFGGQGIKFRKTVLGRNTTVEVLGTVVVRRPKLWGVLSPTLYKVRVSGGGASYSLNAGIRKLTVSSTGALSLNGKKLQTRGVSYLEGDDTVGSAWTPTVRDSNLALITQLGANMIRTHYPPSPQTMEWADRNGILVWVEAPVYRSRETQLKSKKYRANAVSYTKQMVLWNRAHPSVLVYSLMNESIPSGTANLNKLVTAQIAAVHKLDPPGLIGADYAGAPEDELQHPAYRKLDVLGVNEYFGWYPGLIGSTLNINDLPGYLTYLHGAYAHQALFVTEFGVEANRNGPADELGTFQFQNNFMLTQMRLLNTLPFLNGYFAWVLKDYAVRPGWSGGNPDPSPPYSTKGIFDRFGNPKPVAADIEREFKATPPYK